jgi:hypothetical protein
MAKRLDAAMKELENANQRLREDMEHITELSRQRRDFFAAASHELKTPITVLKGQIESMILGIGKYKDTGTALPETLKEVENMERLVREILSISKIEMEGLAGKTEPVALSEILAGVTEILLPLAKERQITVHSQLKEDVSVTGNASLLHKAVHNILSNALRHSPEGAEVFIHLTPSALTVTNTGASIPEDDLPILFAPFYATKPPAAAVWDCISPRPSWINTDFLTVWKTRIAACGLQWNFVTRRNRSAALRPEPSAIKSKINQIKTKNKPSLCMMELHQTKGRCFYGHLQAGCPLPGPQERESPAAFPAFLFGIGPSASMLFRCKRHRAGGWGFALQHWSCFLYPPLCTDDNGKRGSQSRKCAHHFPTEHSGGPGCGCRTSESLQYGALRLCQE